MSTLLLFALASLVAGFSLFGRRGPVLAAIASLALWETLLLAVGLALGHFGLLVPGLYRIVMAAFALLLLAAAGFAAMSRRGAAPGAERAAPHPIRVPRAMRTRRGLLLAGALFVLLGTALLQVAQDGLFGTLQADGLAYHLPRAQLWSEHGDFSSWPAPTFAQVALPVGADLVLASHVLAGGGLRGVSLPGALLALGAALCVFAAARGLRWPRSRALAAAAAFLAFPAAGLRIADLSSDAAAGFPLLAGWVLSAALAPAAGLVLFVVLAGVALACKATAAPFVLLLGVARLAELLKKRYRPSRRELVPLGAALAAGALLVGGSYAPVVRAFGDPTGGETGRSLGSFRPGPSGVARSLGAVLLHWGVEPLGYAPRRIRSEVEERLGLPAAYRALGGRGGDESWRPQALALDASTTGLLPLLALPFLLFSLPGSARARAGWALVLGFVLLFGPFAPYPFLGRYAFVLLAGVALLWGAGFGGRSRPLRAFVSAALLVAATSGLLISGFYLAKARRVFALGEPFLAGEGFPDAPMRRDLERRLGGKPLLVLTRAESHDAFLASSPAGLAYEYAGCPPAGDWTAHFRLLAIRSPLLFLRTADPDERGLGVPYSSLLGRGCLVTPRGASEALASAGWRPVGNGSGFILFAAPSLSEGSPR